MAAPTTCPGDFLLDVANLGQNLTASLLKLNITLKAPDEDLDKILGAVSVAASILMDMGTTINKHKEDVYISEDVTHPETELCKYDFEKLLILSKMASEQELSNREPNLGGRSVTGVKDPWKLFRAELGGREESYDFFIKIKSTPGVLLTLNDTIKYKIYKVLEKQNRLDEEQTFELKRIMSVLPRLVAAIERTAGRKRQPRVAADVKNYLQKLDVETNNEELRKPTIERNDSFATSDFTMYEPSRDEKEDFSIRKTRKDLRAEDDRRSIISADSFHERQSQSHESKFIDVKEVFEEWTIRWYEESKQLVHTKSLFGIHLKEYMVARAVWAKIPELGSQDELRKAYSLMTTNVPESKHRASVMKTIKKLPRQAREALEVLVEERDRATNSLEFKRQWSVVAVQAKIRHRYGGGSLFKSDKAQEWLIMLKGETVDQVHRKQPDWWYDPWRKPKSHHREREQRRAYSSHPQDRQDRMERHRSPSPHYLAGKRERSYSPVGRERRQFSRREDGGHRRNLRSDRYPPETAVMDEKTLMEEAEKKMEEFVKDLPACFAP